MMTENEIPEKDKLMWQAHILALLGLLLYIIQSIIFAHTTPSNLDEGGYLYKGYLFATNVYHPFQPYGVWTNKSPLSFLIPGYVQLIFGAGLRTGRYLAILEGVLAVVGIWIVTRRMAGKWHAVAAVWAMALSPAVIKIYSVGATQSLVACLLTWVLVFSLGKNRSIWELILSSILASVIILSRQNMVIILPLLLAYIFWQHGIKNGVWASLAGIIVFIWGHIVYWPEILQVWLPWVPYAPSFLRDLVSSSGGGQAIWTPQVDWPGRLLSVFQGVRWNFPIMMGILFSFLLLPQKEKWKDMVFTRAFIFLSTLFLGSLFLHSYASLNKDYCVFCFGPYFSFYSVSAIILAALCVSFWNQHPSWFTQLMVVILFIIFSGGTGYSTFEDTGVWLQNLAVPRIRDAQLVGGFTTLGESLANKFSLDQGEIRRTAALGAGLLVGIFVILAVFIYHKWRFNGKHGFAYSLANAVLIVGFIVPQLFAGAQGSPDCEIDVIAVNEEIGRYLRTVLPDNSKVYWEGGLSVVPLLYAPQARIYAPQINDGYAFRHGGDTDALLRYGFWNDELAQIWKNEADVIIVEAWRYSSWKSFFSPDKFEELQPTSAGTSCLKGTELRIFKRISP